MPPVKGKRTPPTPSPEKNGQTAAPQTAGPPAAPKVSDRPDRPVVYPEPVIKEYRVFPDADHSLTVEAAKDILGWEEETDDVKFGRDHEEALSSLVGRKVRLRFNQHNRPLDVPWLLELRQEHLNRRWRMNWDTIVVSKTRQLNQGQHRLISLILAEYARQHDSHQDKHWVKNWPGPVTMQALVVFGAEDEDDTFMTYNRVKGMTYADVLFRSNLLSRFEPPKRRTLAQFLDFSVKTLWDRTGRKHDAYVPKRTPAESDQFLRGHPRLVSAAHHVYEEICDNSLARANLSVPGGTATALLYLFATSNTDPRAWREAREPSENLLDLSGWNKAEEFVSLLVGSSPDLRGVRQILGDVCDPEKGNDTNAERVAVLCKAWNVFSRGHEPTPADCRLDYTRDEDGDLILTAANRHVSVGGIDRGPGGGEAEESFEAVTPSEPVKKPVPTPAQKAAERKVREASRTNLSDDAKRLLAGLREDHAGKVLLFRLKSSSGWQAYEQDAKILQDVCGLTPAQNGVRYVSFPTAKCDAVVAQLQAAGHRVAAVWPGADGETPTEVKDYDLPVPGANSHGAKPKVAPKPKKASVKK